MRRQRWALALLLVVGVALGVAIAGFPSRRHDPPLRVQTEDLTTTTTAPLTTTTVVEPPPPPPSAPSTTARRPGSATTRATTRAP